jgi:hypothetical protein
VQGTIRAYNTGTRNVLLRYVVTDGVTTARLGPFVQQVVATSDPASANAYNLDVLVMTSLPGGTCSITAIDASAVQPDIVEASRESP